MVVDVEDSGVKSFKAFEVGGTFKLNNCLDRLDFSQASCLRFHSFPIAIHQIRGLESDMNKVRTYELSAHQRLHFKVRTQAGD